MIPQADIRWFSSQLFWSLVFFSAVYYFNFYSYFEVKKKRKESHHFLSLRNEQVNSIEKEIKDMQEVLINLKETEKREKEFIKVNIQEEYRVSLMRSMEDHISEQETSLKYIESSAKEWVKSINIQDVKSMVSILLTKIEGEE